jgi:hypothetical protein
MCINRKETYQRIFILSTRIKLPLITGQKKNSILGFSSKYILHQEDAHGIQFLVYNYFI